MVITVTDSRVFRAYTFLPHGQRMEQWLPKGTYEYAGEVWLDSVSQIRALMLYGLDERNKGTWYVSTNHDLMNHEKVTV